jgi:hypothetical protein
MLGTWGDDAADGEVTGVFASETLPISTLDEALADALASGAISVAPSGESLATPAGEEPNIHIRVGLQGQAAAFSERSLRYVHGDLLTWYVTEGERELAIRESWKSLHI